MRYKRRRTFINNEELYAEQFKNRNVESIKHYGTPRLKHTRPVDLDKISTTRHLWKTGDRFYKLASAHYGNPRYWWVIAWFNKKPTESHLKYGDLIFIPTQLSEVLKVYGIYY